MPNTDPAGNLIPSRIFRGTASVDRLQDGMIINFDYLPSVLNDGDMVVVALKDGGERSLFVEHTSEGREYLAYVGSQASLHFDFVIRSREEMELVFEAHHNLLPVESF